jgi:hypothetical protein
MIEDPPDVTRGNLTGRWCSDDIIELQNVNEIAPGNIKYYFLIVSISDLEEILRELRKQEGQ